MAGFLLDYSLQEPGAAMLRALIFVSIGGSNENNEVVYFHFALDRHGWRGVLYRHNLPRLGLESVDSFNRVHGEGFYFAWGQGFISFFF